MARLLVVALALFVLPSTAYGADDKAHLPPNRDELVPVPAPGGNSDIGVVIGASLTYARFREGYRPFAFRMDLVAEVSVKDDATGFHPVQQYYTLHFDLPQLFTRRLRLDARVDFVRRVGSPWYGIGNATAGDPRPTPAGATSGYQYVEERPRLRTLARIKTDTPFDIAISTNTRYEFPTVYPGSKLSDDLASGAVVGGKEALLETLGAGVMVDTRDNEFRPSRGIFYQLGIGGTLGSAEGVRYGEVAAVLSHYAPLGGPFVFASRMIGSFQFGTVPFYELQQGGVFTPQYLVGGNRGIRGVVMGRYAGPIKLVSNTEIRIAPFSPFRVLAWDVRIGMVSFFDAGRVWSDYSFHDLDADGTKVGLKWGTGGGLFFQFDEANVFIINVAYAPTSGGRGFPLSYYLENGFHF